MVFQKPRKYFENTFFTLKWEYLARFATLWLFIGFSVGTGLLLGPVRKITEILRGPGWSASSENLVIIPVILIYIIATFLFALFFTRMSVRSNQRHVAKGIFIIWLCLSIGSLYLWFSPSMLGSKERITVSANPRFTFGSYPSANDVKALKQEGYTVIISLLHPAVVPFEPELIRRERNAAEENGITFIHLPMLPWISDNRTSLDSLKSIVQTGTGKYYVHCYLGQDRIGTARRIVESIDTSIKINDQDSLITDRDLTTVEDLERGEVFVLAKDVFVTPYPTDDEYVKYVFGRPFTVISLMNPENERDVSWIEKERKILSNYEILFYNYPISLTKYDANDVLQAARKAKSITPPLLIHGFRAPGFRSQAFIEAYKSDLPPIPSELFPDSISTGATKIISPNVAVGPRPDGPEFGSVLERNGIKKFIFLGNPTDTSAQRDSIITNAAGISWRSFSSTALPTQQLLDTLRTGGPWYLYGPEIDLIKDTLESKLGATFPDSATNEITSLDKKHSNSFVKDFISNWIPSLKLTILLSPALLIYVVFAALFAGYLRKSKNIATAYTRKIFHVLIFVMAGVLQLLISLHAVVLFGIITSTAVIYATFRGKGFPFYQAMARPKDEPKKTLFIIVPLITTAAGGVLSNLLFGPIAYIGYLVTGLGDAVGEPVGKRWGKHTYKVPSLAGVPAERSYEGSTAVLLTSIGVSFIALLAGGYGPITALGTALMCGIAAACVEAVSNHGLDNLTIQVAATAVAYFLLL